MSEPATDPRNTKLRRRGKASKLDKYRHLIGKVPDSEVAAKAGITSSGVAKYRRTHGIPAAGAARQDDGEAESEALPPEPGEEAQAAPAQAKARRRPPPPRRTSKLDAHREHIGVLSDREVAEKAGVTRNAVQMYRRKHGIAAARPPGASGPLPPGPRPARPAPQPQRKQQPKAARGPSGRRSKIDAHRDLVGRVSDREVAEKAGVTVNAVQLYRKKHGIAAASRGGRPAGSGSRQAARASQAPRQPQAEAAAQAAPARSSNGGRVFGWRLRIESKGQEVVRIVVAADAAAACTAARSVGDTIAVERLGEAIG